MANTSYVTSDEGVNGGRSYKGLNALIESVKNGDNGVETRLQNNEQLEFLGDAVLEYICRLVIHSRRYLCICSVRLPGTQCRE